MKRIFALLCHVAILLTAFHWNSSTGGFLITGLGFALLLDRYVLGLLPWPAIAWKKDLLVRAATFFGGGLVFFSLRPGVVPIREAAYLGMMVCLGTFLLEQFVTLLHHFLGKKWNRIPLWGILVALLVLIIPLIAALHPIHTVPKRTPAAFGQAFEDVRFQTVDGLELAAWLVPHPQPRGNVIFCHGHGRNRGHVAAFLPTFHDLGLNVLAFDFRGHGDSQGHTSTFGQREVQDLIAAQAYLNQRCPNQPFLLAGISLGAAVSLQALPCLPNVHGVWCEGAFAQFQNAVNYKFSALPGPLRAMLVDFYNQIAWLDSGFWAPAVNPIDHLKNLTVPIFFCHGQEDDLVPITEAQALYETYSGPKWNWWVHGASHYNVRQLNHEEYLRRLRGFLETCLPGKRAQ